MLFIMKDKGRSVCVYDLKEALNARDVDTAPPCLLELKSFENFLDLGGFRRPMGLVQDDLHTLRVSFELTL